MHHTDRGGRYASEAYRTALTRRDGQHEPQGELLGQHRGRELLRAELVDHQTYPSTTYAEASIRAYIEVFYNVERLHSHLQ